MNIFNTTVRNAGIAGITGFCAYSLQNRKNLMANAEGKRIYFESASTLNPMYDKRWKLGEDNLLERPNFLCVLDGVGGWVNVLVDSGQLTKEYIRHVADIVGEGLDLSMPLSKIMDEALAVTKSQGSTTVTMAYLTQDHKLKTCNLGDSGYLLLRPTDGKL